MTNEEPPTKPKKRTSRFYKVLAITISLAIILGVVIFELSNAYQNSYGSGPVEIEITTDKPFYLQGEEINFTIYVTNPYDWKIPCPDAVTFQIKGKDNFEHTTNMFVDFVPNGRPSFSPNSKQEFYTYTWDQKTRADSNITFVQPGNYTFSVTFSGPVAYGDSGSCIFEIREKP